MPTVPAQQDPKPLSTVPAQQDPRILSTAPVQQGPKILSRVPAQRDRYTLSMVLVLPDPGSDLGSHKCKSTFATITNRYPNM